MPTHNYGLFISQAIKSVLDQDYPGDKIEIIVIDDGSTDNTREIVRKYAGRVTYLYSERKGIAAARNKGMSLARGEIITFLDADDVWACSRTRKVVETFNEHPDVGIVFHNFDVIDRNAKTLFKNFYETFCGKKGRKGLLLFDAINGNVFCGGSSFSFKRNLLKEICPIPEDIRRGVDFYIAAIASCHAQAFYLPEILGKYRLHQKNLTFFVTADPAIAAEIYRDFSHTYEKVLSRLSGIISAEERDLKALRRRLSRNNLLFSVLSGKRVDAIKQFPALFKSAGSSHEVLSNIGLVLLTLFMPVIGYSCLVKCYYYFKKVLYRAGNRCGKDDSIVSQQQ